MAYKVHFKIPERELGKVDIVVTIVRDNKRHPSARRGEQGKEMLGELRLSKGGVDWHRKGVKKRVSKRWDQLARLVDSTRQ